MLTRDLRALAREVDAYPTDELLWRTAPGIANSAATLALHLVGNLEHFVGAVLGQTGFVRDRDAEFATHDLTRAELRSRIEAAVETVDSALAKLTPEQFEAAYPVPVGGRTVRTTDFLVHLVAHLGYHLGQIDYHRRMLAPAAGPIEAVSVAELAELGLGG